MKDVKRANKMKEVNALATALSIIMMSVALLSMQTHAYEGDGTSIITTFGIQSIGTLGVNTVNNLEANVTGGNSLSGNYSGGAYSGFFGRYENSNSQENLNSGNITLHTPFNSTVFTNTNLTFRINSTLNNAQNCSLIIDGQIVSTINNPASGQIEFNRTIIYGRHNWTARCIDENSNIINATSIRTLTIFNATNFDDDTTDLTSVDLTAIPNLTLSRSGFGKIIFEGLTDLSGGADLTANIQISNRTITVNSQNLPNLNKTARLTMIGTGLQNPAILRDGIPCTDCTIISTTPNLIFNVTHFTTYTATENSQLTIWDGTDNAAYSAGQTVNFYANYSAVMTNLPISGPQISCEITYQDGGPFNMTYNSTSTYYEYNRTFNAPGIYDFTVNCTDATNTFTSIELSENAIISQEGGPSLVRNVTIISSERRNESLNATGQTVDAGNITEMSVQAKMTSRSWTGIYGNVSAGIVLQDASGNNFYNWTGSSLYGEVYAARTASIDFSSIECTNSSEVAAEELYLGQLQTDPDTVNKTFNKTNHPGFLVGNTVINPSSCKTTNTYVNSAAQNSNFHQVLLSDAASNIVYTALMNGTIAGFKNQQTNFQMLLGVNGKTNSSATTTYYFFLEVS